MPFGSKASLRVMLVSRLTIRACGCAAPPFVESRAPNVSEIHGPRHGAVCLFGKTQIVDR